MFFKLLGRFLVTGCWLTAVTCGVNWFWLVLLGPQLFLLPPLLDHIGLQPPKLAVPSIPFLQRLIELISTKKHRSVMPYTQGGTVTVHRHPEGRRRLMKKSERQERKREEEEEEEEVDHIEEVNNMEEDAVYDKLSMLQLRDFYGLQVCHDRMESPKQLCELAQHVVEFLLCHIRDFGPCCQAVLHRSCVGVGSMFEGWGINRGQQVRIYDLLVPLNAPEGLRLEVELQFEQQSLTEGMQDDDDVRFPTTPPPPEIQGTACVDVKAVPEVPRERSFGSRSGLEDFVERVQSERITEGLNYLLEECFAIDQQMEPERVLTWLGVALRKAWVNHGVAKLTFWGQGNPCVMRLQTASEKVLYISVAPAVHVPDLDLYVVARPGPGFGFDGRTARWETWFCRDEGFYLQRVARSLPLHRCHLVCLEILTYLNRSSTPFATRAINFISSYHLKTALLHLLHTHVDAHTHTHTQPQHWDGPCVVERLEEMLRFLQTCISQQQLLSFWVGNQALGDQGPALLRSAAPLNLFWRLKQRAWAQLAQEELRWLRLRLHCSTTGAALPHSLPLQTSKADRKRTSASRRRRHKLNASGLQAATNTRSHKHRAVTKTLSQATVKPDTLNPHSGATLHQDSHTHIAEVELDTEM